MPDNTIIDAIDYERQLLENVLCDDDESAAISRRLLDLFYSCDDKSQDLTLPEKSYKDPTPIL